MTGPIDWQARCLASEELSSKRFESLLVLQGRIAGMLPVIDAAVCVVDAFGDIARVRGLQALGRAVKAYRRSKP